MNGTENMLTCIITSISSDKAEKNAIFRGHKKTINHSLAAKTLATRVFESGKKTLNSQ